MWCYHAVFCTQPGSRYVLSVWILNWFFILYTLMLERVAFHAVVLYWAAPCYILPFTLRSMLGGALTKSLSQYVFITVTSGARRSHGVLCVASLIAMWMNGRWFAEVRALSLSTKWERCFEFHSQSPYQFNTMSDTVWMRLIVEVDMMRLWTSYSANGF